MFHLHMVQAGDFRRTEAKMSQKYFFVNVSKMTQ